MYKVGDIVKCIITGFKEYGIFVNIDNDYDGLIHISEISESFVKDVHDYGTIGEVIYANIIEVDEVNKHLKLSIKNTNYKINGKRIDNTLENGFLPLKNHLNVWVNEKLKEMKNNQK